MINKYDYGVNTLSRLYSCINKDKLITYYQEEEQDPDKVLNIFVRTNSGGAPLSISDLLMSIAVANFNNSTAINKLKKILSEGDFSFAINDNVWDTVLNLQLLDGSKGDASLADWVKDYNFAWSHNF